MKPRTNRDGYLVLRYLDPISKKYKDKFVHRLVALEFISNPKKLPQINHKDFDKKNNAIENLEWCTNEYNHRYNREHKNPNIRFK